MSSSLASDKSKAVDGIAKFIVDLGVGDLTTPLLEGFKPAMGIFGPVSYFTLFPVIEGLSLAWHELHALGIYMVDDPTGMADALVQRIKERERARIELEGQKRKSKLSSIRSRIRSMFHR